MKRVCLFTLVTVCMLTSLMTTALANNAEYHKHLNIGPTGIWAIISKDCSSATVSEVTAQTPAYGKVKAGDIITAVNGIKLKGKIGDYILGTDPRRILGEAIGKAEATDGRMVFSITRGDKTLDVTIVLPVLGAYSKTWPEQCKKSDIIIKQSADYLKRVQRRDGSFAFAFSPGGTGENIGSCFAALFLLSTDDPDNIAAARRYAYHLADDLKTKGADKTSHWAKGYMGMLLAEYFLKTGDKKILGSLSALCKAAAQSQAIGCWGHGGEPKPGYSHGGVMSLTSLPILSALILARECGVTEGEDAFKRSFALKTSISDR